MADAQYIADRIAFCIDQMQRAVRRGDTAEAQIWRELIEDWKVTPGYDPNVKGRGYAQPAK